MPVTVNADIVAVRHI